MKIGVTIDDHFANILEAIGQKNKVKLGGVCRLIVESQLTFYQQTGKIPTFFNSVGFTYDKVVEQKQAKQPEHEEKYEEDPELSETLFADNSTETPDEENEDLIPGIDY